MIYLTRNYKELIIKAVNEENWNEVAKLANDAKLNHNEETAFGIKKGYINVFKHGPLGWNQKRKYAEIVDGLTKIGYSCFDVNAYISAGIKGAIKAFTEKYLEDYYNNNYCVVLTDNVNFCNFLSKSNYPIQYLTLSSRTTTKSNGDKITRFYVNNANEKYVFKDMNQIRASLRDDRINEIFDDEL